MKEAATDQAAVAATLRAWWVLGYRRWRESVTGRPSRYGEKPIPRWDGGEDADGRRFKPVWPGLADYCVENGLDPRKLTRAYFKNCGLSSVPAPTHLKSARLLDKYAEFDEATASSLAAALERMDRAVSLIYTTCRVNNVVDPHKISERYEQGLRDSMGGFSALFRYCMFVVGGAPVAAREFFADAVREYVFDRDGYDKVWGDRIPDDVRREADRFHRAISKGARP